MPLSEQEQRLLEEMERNLYRNDADFVHAVGGVRGRRPNYRAIVLGVLLAVAGVGALIAGVALQLLIVGILGLRPDVRGRARRDHARQARRRSRPHRPSPGRTAAARSKRRIHGPHERALGPPPGGPRAKPLHFAPPERVDLRIGPFFVRSADRVDAHRPSERRNPPRNRRRLSAAAHHRSSRVPPLPSTPGSPYSQATHSWRDREIERMSLISGWEWSKVGLPGFWPEERGWCGVPRQLRTKAR